MTVRKKLYINGQWRAAAQSSEHGVINPATGKVCDTVASALESDVDAAVVAAGAAGRGAGANGGGSWSKWAPAERGRMLYQTARLIRAAKDELAGLLREENGKTVVGAQVEVESAARYTEYYAGIADKIQGSELALAHGVSDYVRREPLGVTAHIVPWNYPLDVFCRSVAPALAAGNTVVAKPSLETARATQSMVGLFEEAGVPAGVLNSVPGEGGRAGARLAGHPDVEGLVFTGSLETGRTVLELAGRNITPIIAIELGSKCPALVFCDGPLLDAAIGETVGNMSWNCGQSCGQRSRVYVDRRVYDRFITGVEERLRAVRIGMPDDPGAQLGPLANASQYAKYCDYLERGRRAGARELAGPKLPESLPGDGYFVRPTAFADCRQEMDIVRDEVFGPMVAIVPVDTFSDAIELANDSRYGLSAAVWTDSVKDEHRAIRELNAGHVTVNGSGAFGFEVPFGGVGDSGYGREGGPQAIYAYTREKNVYVTH